MKGAVKIKIDIMPDNLYRRIYIGYENDVSCSEFISVPTSPVKFNHSFIINAIKIEPKLYNIINQLNIAITIIGKDIDVCIGFAVEGSIIEVKGIANLVVNGNIKIGRNVTKNILDDLCELREELSAFNGFSKISEKIKSVMGVDLKK